MHLATTDRCHRRCLERSFVGECFAFHYFSLSWTFNQEHLYVFVCHFSDYISQPVKQIANSNAELQVQRWRCLQVRMVGKGSAQKRVERSAGQWVIFKIKLDVLRQYYPR